MSNKNQAHIPHQTVEEALERIMESDYQTLNDASKQLMKASDSPKDISPRDLALVIEYARQQVINNNQNLYVLQDSRDTHDDRLLFWAKNAAGYTTDLDQAHRFTEEEALAQHQNRETDIPVSVKALSPATPEMLRGAARMQVIEAREQASVTPMRIDQPILPSDGDEAIFDTQAIRSLTEAHEDGDTPVLVAYRAGEPATLDTVIIDPQMYQWHEYQTNPNMDVSTLRLSELAARFWQIDNVEQAFNHSNWQRLANFMTDALDNLDSDPELWSNKLTDHVPSDLPEVVAKQRLDLINEHKTPRITPGKMRLTELMMAARYGEPVNKHLFVDRNTLLMPFLSWREGIESEDAMSDLADTFKALEEDAKDLREELANLGTQDIPADQYEKKLTETTFALKVVEQELRENDLMYEQYHAFMERQMRNGVQIFPVQPDTDNETAPAMG